MSALIKNPMVNVVEFRMLHGSIALLAFDDGSTRIVDLEPLMRGPIFDDVRANGQVGSAVLDPELGTLVWPNGADLPPESLRYQDGASYGAASVRGQAGAALRAQTALFHEALTNRPIKPSTASLRHWQHMKKVRADFARVLAVTRNARPSTLHITYRTPLDTRTDVSHEVTVAIHAREAKQLDGVSIKKILHDATR